VLELIGLVVLPTCGRCCCPAAAGVDAAPGRGRCAAPALAAGNARRCCDGGPAGGVPYDSTDRAVGA